MNKHFCFFVVLLLALAPLKVRAQTGNRAYAGGGYGTGVDIIDVDSMTRIGSLPDAGGYRMVLSLDGKKLYSTGGNSFIYITDTAADTLIKAFDPSAFPVTSNELEGIAISPDGGKVYVVDEMTTAVFVLDTSDDTIIQATDLSTDESENAVLGPDGQFLYVNDNTWASKFSTVTFECLGFVDTGSDGHGIAISQDGTKLYAEGPGIIVIDADSMTSLDTLNAGGYYLETSKDGSRVYGVNESNKLAVIDAEADTLIDIRTLSSFGCAGVTTNQTGQIILVAGRTKLIKLDAGSLTETGEVSGRYRSVALFEPNDPVPVELTSFTASVVENGVILEWQTQTETNNFGFDIERMEASNWEAIAFVKGNGTTTHPQHYEYVDPLPNDLANISTRRYRLRQIDTDGSFEYSHVIEVDLSLPKTAQLLQNYPNPFNPTTLISYSIPSSDFVSLKVYDLLGQEVQTLVGEFQQAGTYAISFDGAGLSSGLYFYKLYLRNRLVNARKMALVR
ncbi:MAG: T9SS type A sorting domain-containing protein [bacterium]